MNIFIREDYTLSDGKLMAYAWPGGYPMFYLTVDGATLCPKCANLYQCFLSGVDVNYEDEHLFCDNCNKQIEAAYGED